MQIADQTSGRLTARLRSDLIQSYQQENGTPSLIVKDPRCGRFFRFAAIEAFVLGRLGGDTDPEQLLAAVEEQFGAPLPREVLDQFVARLGRLGLLETGQPAVTETTPKARRVRGNLLYLRFPGLDPDRLLDWLHARLSFCFTRSFVIVSGFAVLSGLAFTLSNWEEIARDLPRLYNVRSLLVMYLTVLVVVGFHEFAHGLTCKHFGGSVREMGFMLLYFQPAFYCNVSDAWLFPRKSQRLWVTFAGAYFELFLWAIATLIWWITDPETFINYLALVVMGTSAVKSLFNLNPLIKLDGYYLLSDLLEVPNLRQRAIAYWGNLLRRWFGTAAPYEVTRRERRIFRWYGLLAWTYSTALLVTIGWHFFGFLTERYQGWGFAVFTVLLAQVFHAPLKRSFGVRQSVPGSPKMKKWLKSGVRYTMFLGAACALYFVRTDLRVSGQFFVLPAHNCDVRAEVDSIIQSVQVNEGQPIRRGDPIVELSDRDWQAELTKTQAQIQETEARLRLLEAGPRREELELARTVLTKTEELVQYSLIHLRMDEALFKQQVLSGRDLETTKERVALRRNEMEEARDKLKLLQAGNRREEIEATAAELNRLVAHRSYVESQLKLLKVLSPVDGIVTTYRIGDKIGQAVRKGDLIAEVHELRRVTVEIQVSEKDIADVGVGQRVILKARAYPLNSFEARVAGIAPVASEIDSTTPQRTVRVTTELENPKLLLKPEMTGAAKIYCGEKALWEIVARRFIRFFKVDFWSWW